VKRDLRQFYYTSERKLDISNFAGKLLTVCNMTRSWLKISSSPSKTEKKVLILAHLFSYPGRGDLMARVFSKQKQPTLMSQALQEIREAIRKGKHASENMITNRKRYWRWSTLETNMANIRSPGTEGSSLCPKLIIKREKAMPTRSSSRNCSTPL
jgi:hypothetical protein